MQGARCEIRVVTHEPKVNTMQRIQNLLQAYRSSRTPAEVSAPKATAAAAAASDHYASSPAPRAPLVAGPRGLTPPRARGAVASHEAGWKIMAQQNPTEVRAWLDANTDPWDRLATFFRLVTDSSVSAAQRFSAVRVLCDALDAPHALDAPELRAMLTADSGSTRLLLRAVCSLMSRQATCYAIRRVPGLYEQLGLDRPVLGKAKNP